MEYTLENIKELRTEYNKALNTQRIEFEFKGHTLLIGYAKYLLEYLEKQVEKI